MKKLMIGLAVVAFAFTLTSCSKTCECTYKVLGVETKVEVEKPEGTKCSELTKITVGSTTIDLGVECK